MATETVSRDDLEDVVTEERRQLALEALWEVEAIASLVCERSDELEASDLWIRALAVRLVDLSRVGMTSLDDYMPGAFDDAQKLLRPFQPRAAVEVDHG